MELCGKTMGIVGYGAIGRRVADIALAFGMRVLVKSRRPVCDTRVQEADLDTLLRESDVVSLHCPLTADNADMMNADSFAKMKDGAIFVNTARGGLVDEFALAEALKSGKLKAAGIDVLKKEPMSPDCPLIGIDNCILTPHISWAGRETRLRLLDIVEENLACFLKGDVQNRVG